MIASASAIGQTVLVKCDDDETYLGKIVGTATCVGANSSVWGYDNEVHFNYVVELPMGGWLDKEDMPRTFINSLLVHPDNVEPAPFYVNVYELDRAYGGPEEGGWYYNSGEVVATHGPCDEHEARALATEWMNGEYKSTGDSGSVIYNGGDYKVVIEYTPGENYPKEIPHYE